MFQKIECDTTFDFVTCAAADFDNDGDEDLAFGRLSHATEIWLNPYPAVATPCAWQRKVLFQGGIGATALVAADFDNDGDQDLFLGKQNPNGSNPATVLLNNGDGTLTEDASAGVGLWSQSAEMQATWGDFNADGFLDLVVGSNQAAGFAHAALFLNRYKEAFSTNHSLVLHPLFDAPGSKNLDAIGATVNVTAGGNTLLRTVQSGAPWHAISPNYIHVGVGNQPVAAVSVTWTNGATTQFGNLETDKCYVLKFSTGQAIPCDAASGVDDKQADAFGQLSISPNPAFENASLELYAIRRTEAQIRVLNLQSKVLRSYSTVFEEGENMFVIEDLESLPAGYYFVSVADLQTGRSAVWKMVVAR
jgi:hypothetical protein